MSILREDSRDDSQGVSRKLRPNTSKSKTSKTKTQKLFAAVLRLSNVWLYWCVWPVDTGWVSPIIIINAHGLFKLTCMGPVPGIYVSSVRRRESDVIKNMEITSTRKDRQPEIFETPAPPFRLEWGIHFLCKWKWVKSPVPWNKSKWCMGIIIVTNFVILFVYIRKYLLATILFCKFELYILQRQPLSHWVSGYLLVFNNIPIQR